MAIFIMGVGLLSLLALFPMGALSMAQAVKDERTHQTACMMEGYGKFLWREAWTNAQGLRDERNVLSGSPELVALDSPGTLPGGVIAYLNSPGYQARRLEGSPSSPVYIDPIGHATQPGGTSQNWVGYPYTVLPRRSVTISPFPPGGVLPTTVRIRMCSLLDDLTFDTNGLPPPNFVQRAGDYNAAWLIQRSKNNVRTEINLQVVVYRKRPPADTSVPEIPIATPIVPAAAVGTRQLSVTLFGGVPAPKAGTWLLLAGAQSGVTEAFADFYRVVSVAGRAPNVTFEFSQPIRSHNAQGQQYSGVLIQMENVAEVFDKGTLSIGDRPTQ